MIQRAMMDLDWVQKIGKISMGYYEQIPFNPTEHDFDLWIESMNEPMKSHFKKDGLQKCRGVLNFQRFWLEMRDFGMDEYMKKHLSAEDYEYWVHPLNSR